MARLWVDQLRGAGRFGGRVLLLTNLKDLPPEATRAGVEPVRVDLGPVDRPGLFMQRVLLWERLPVEAGDRVMQLDLDALAMRPLDPLFESMSNESLSAAPSRLTPLDPMHAGPLLSRPRRVWKRWLGWDRRAGLSASVTGGLYQPWQRAMRAWATAIRKHRGTPPPLGDQSFLNLLLIRGSASLTAFPAGLIHHVGHEESPSLPAAEAASVLHFPFPDRLVAMRLAVARNRSPGVGRPSNDEPANLSAAERPLQPASL